MLRELSVQNLALIEDVHVELQGGYLRLDRRDRGGQEPAAHGARPGARRQGLGRPGARGQVRGAGRGGVRGRRRRRCEAELEACSAARSTTTELILTRRISAQGRSSAQANGLPVTVATLQALGERLIDIHGQHEGRALLEPDRQRACSTPTAASSRSSANISRARADARGPAAEAARP